MAKQPEPGVQYFSHRGVNPGAYLGFRIPPYLTPHLPQDRNIRILDIGCGFGQFLVALRDMGYTRLTGADISAEAVDHCLAQGLDVHRIGGIRDLCTVSQEPFHLILMSHVLEHIPKSDIIETLQLIRERLMVEGATIFVAVPNAQSPTGCYWAYEDFTHTTLFTAGSLLFVLKSAGFTDVRFLDPDGLGGGRSLFRLPKKLLLRCYRAKILFWNLVTNSAFHAPSPQIFTYELKALAR